MTAIPWQATGLDHRARVVPSIPGPAPETCVRCVDEPVASEHAEAGLGQMCADEIAQDAFERRNRQGWEQGLDVKPGMPYVRLPFPTTTHEEL